MAQPAAQLVKRTDQEGQHWVRQVHAVIQKHELLPTVGASGKDCGKPSSWLPKAWTLRQQEYWFTEPSPLAQPNKQGPVA